MCCVAAVLGASVVSASHDEAKCVQFVEELEGALKPGSRNLGLGPDPGNVDSIDAAHVRVDEFSSVT
jgi:hypothetical protein